MPPIINTIVGIVLLFAGAWSVLMGTGLIRVGKNPETSTQWRKKWGKFLLVAGIVSLVGGAANLLL